MLKADSSTDNKVEQSITFYTDLITGNTTELTEITTLTPTSTVPEISIKSNYILSSSGGTKLPLRRYAADDETEIDDYLIRPFINKPVTARAPRGVLVPETKIATKIQESTHIKILGLLRRKYKQ